MTKVESLRAIAHLTKEQIAFAGVLGHLLAEHWRQEWPQALPQTYINKVTYRNIQKLPREP